MYFNHNDKKALCFLTALILIASLMVFVLAEDDDTIGEEVLTTVAVNDSTSSRTEGRAHASRQPVIGVPDEDLRPRELFAFDPNTADSTALLRLGLQPWQIRNIYHYRARGGIYRKPSDFSRLYGLSAHQYKQLLPYIDIHPDYTMTAAEYEESLHPEEKSEPEKRRSNKLAAGEHIVLNTADSAQLTRIPGIGKGFAQMILYYGERLGGYVSVDQLDEIEDFPSSAKAYLVISNPTPRRMNINKLTVGQMKRHPYINFYQARDIAEHRRLHGPISSLRELSSFPSFTASDLSRLEPYVCFR